MYPFSKIDARPGRELGLSGRYADIPAFQIVTDTHDQFYSLNALFISIEYGQDKFSLKSHSEWPDIRTKVAGFSERLRKLNGNAIEAAALSEDVQKAENSLNALIARSTPREGDGDDK